MRWLADECISGRLVRDLRTHGHDVIYISELSPSAKDEIVLQFASRERRLLLTDDKDFGELVFGRKIPGVYGVIFIKISDERDHLFWPRLQAAVERFGDGLHDLYLVIEETRMWARRLPA